MKKWEDKIYYSQCWEDPFVLLEALDVQKGDNVLSITSGGCNTLTLLLKDPQKVTALDTNPVQNYLLELKMAAIKNLPYEELLAFFGIGHSANRQEIYNQIESRLSGSAQAWWRRHPSLIQNGILHCGKLEKFFKVFRAVILPLAHNEKTVQALFAQKTKQQQSEFYEQTWNTWRWRLLFRLFFSKKVTSSAARNPQFFEYLKKENISKYYLDKTKQAMCDDPWNNFILYYIFTGKYDHEHLPLYLERNNLSIIKERLGRIEIVSQDLESFLRKSTENFTKYNLSNIFEAFSLKLTEAVFLDILAKSNAGTRLLYINHMVTRTFPKHLEGRLAHDTEKEKILNQKNLAFFYETAHVDYIK